MVCLDCRTNIIWYFGQYFLKKKMHEKKDTLRLCFYGRLCFEEIKSIYFCISNSRNIFKN